MLVSNTLKPKDWSLSSCALLFSKNGVMNGLILAAWINVSVSYKFIYFLKHIYI